MTRSLPNMQKSPLTFSPKGFRPVKSSASIRRASVQSTVQHDDATVSSLGDLPFVAMSKVLMPMARLPESLGLAIASEASELDFGRDLFRFLIAVATNGPQSDCLGGGSTGSLTRARFGCRIERPKAKSDRTRDQR
jgi:hypothetical protein